MNYLFSLISHYYGMGEHCRDCGAHVNEAHRWSKTEPGEMCKWARITEVALKHQFMMNEVRSTSKGGFASL